MLVQPADGSQVVSYHICRVPLIVCDTRARAMFAVVGYHVISSLSHDFVLGFDWLRTCNPHVDWQACTLSVKVPGGLCPLPGLPCNSIVHIELISLDSVCKEVDLGVVAWFTLVHLVEPPNAMGACGTFDGGESRES